MTDPLLQELARSRQREREQLQRIEELKAIIKGLRKLVRSLNRKLEKLRDGNGISNSSGGDRRNAAREKGSKNGE